MRGSTPRAVLLLGGLVAGASACADRTEGELRAAVSQYYLDMSRRDWPAYAGHFWPGATLTTAWQPPGEPAERVVVTTIEEFLAQTPQGPDSKPIFEERLLEQDVDVQGDVAQVRARYEARFGDSLQVETWRGTDAFTWLRHDGKWRIAALVYAND